MALARALAVKPQVLLLDEPLSALDAKIRVSLREEIRALQRELGITTIYVTHDQEEALSMSDRIVVMSEGRVEQVGTPFEIYNYPAHALRRLVRRHAQHPAGTVVDPAPGGIAVDGQEIVATRGVERREAGDARSVALRPRAVTLDGAGGRRATAWQGTIEEVSFLGSVVRIRVRFGDNAVSLDTFNNPNAPPPERGQR